MDRHQQFHPHQSQPPRSYGNIAQQQQQQHHQQFAPFQHQPHQHRPDLHPPRPPHPQDVQHQDPLHMAALQALDLLRMHSPGMAQTDIASFLSDVELLMSDCSQANIQAGKSWIAQNCHNPQQIDLVARAIVAIAISRKTFEDKLHLLYLVNDIMSHSDRKQLPWIKDALCPHLVAILRVAYYIPGIDDSQRQRVIKVLDIWRNKAFFPTHILDSMEMDVKRPPLLPGVPTSNTEPTPQSQFHGNPAYPQQSHQPPAALRAGLWPSLPQQPLSDLHLETMSRQPNTSNFAQSQPHQEAMPLHQQHQQLHQSPHRPPPVPPTFQHHSPPVPVPVPTPAYRDAVTKDLPAALMASRIDSEARFYEPMPFDVSIPLKRDESKQAAVLGALTDFLAEEQGLSTAVRTPGDDGWHQGTLDKFHDTVLWKRKQAFSKGRRMHDVQAKTVAHRGRARSPSYSRSRSRSQSRPRPRDRPSHHEQRSTGDRRSNSRSRSRGRHQRRSLSRGRGNRHRSFSKSRSISRGGSRCRSRSRSRSRSRDGGRRGDISPQKQRGMEEAFPARSFTGLGAGGSRAGSGSQTSRPMFQPARHQPNHDR